jgi:predicted RND superfamily exporter protein
MLLYVYAAVTLFCLITFRSWRATLVALLPLMLTSMLCEALMVIMGIGVKVATLPVIALGVGSAWTTRCCSACSCTTSAGHAVGTGLP